MPTRRTMAIAPANIDRLCVIADGLKRQTTTQLLVSNAALFHARMKLF